MQEFVDRVERGEVRSRYTYSKFKNILQEPSLKNTSGTQANRCLVYDM